MEGFGTDKGRIVGLSSDKRSTGSTSPMDRSPSSSPYGRQPTQTYTPTQPDSGGYRSPSLKQSNYIPSSRSGSYQKQDYSAGKDTEAYRRDLNTSNSNMSPLLQPSDTERAIAELKKEMVAIKFHHQGELNRLNQNISTLQLENSGLKNLRTVLETQLEKFKDIKKEYDALQAKLSKTEVENVGLKNKIEAVNTLLKSRTEEFEKNEADFKNKLKDANQEILHLQTQLADVVNVSQMRTVLLGIENERLHSVIDTLYEKTKQMTRDHEENTRNLEAELAQLRDAHNLDKRSVSSQIKDLEARIAELDHQNKMIHEDNDRLKMEYSELQRELEHWKDRYKMLENSHKYLVDAVDKMRHNNHVDLNVSIAQEDQVQTEDGVSIDAKSLLKEASHFKEKAFTLERRTVMFMIEVERLHAIIAGLTKELAKQGGKPADGSYSPNSTTAAYSTSPSRINYTAL